MEKRLLLDVSPTGVQHHVAFEDGQLFTVEHTPTRIESDIIDTCKAMRSLDQRRSVNIQHAARIPINTYMAWKKEWREKWADTYTWPTFEVMKLNSRDNCQLRTGKGSGVYGRKL